MAVIQALSAVNLINVASKSADYDNARNDESRPDRKRYFAWCNARKLIIFNVVHIVLKLKKLGKLASKIPDFFYQGYVKVNDDQTEFQK